MRSTTTGSFSGDAAAFVARTIRRMREEYKSSQHRISNILIELHDDIAFVESYVVAVHSLHDERIEMAGARYVDRFARREGSWKIARRLVLIDWDLSVASGEASPHLSAFPRGAVECLRPSLRSGLNIVFVLLRTRCATVKAVFVAGTPQYTAHCRRTSPISSAATPLRRAPRNVEWELVESTQCHQHCHGETAACGQVPWARPDLTPGIPGDQVLERRGESRPPVDCIVHAGVAQYPPADPEARRCH